MTWTNRTPRVPDSAGALEIELPTCDLIDSAIGISRHGGSRANSPGRVAGYVSKYVSKAARLTSGTKLRGGQRSPPTPGAVSDVDERGRPGRYGDERCTAEVGASGGRAAIRDLGRRRLRGSCVWTERRSIGRLRGETGARG